MKAAVLRARGDVRVEDVPVPQLTADGVLLRVLAASICNATDNHIVWAEDPTRTWPYKPYPSLLGHECVGEVVEVGQQAGPFHPGDCLVFWGLEYGAFAEFVVVRPATLAWMITPKGIPAENLAGLEMAIGAARLLMDPGRGPIIEPTDRCLVVGLGPAGLIYIQLLHALGVHEVVAVGRRPLRQEKARQLGAALAVDAIDSLEGAMDGRVDVLVDATGSDIVDTALSLLRRGGTFVPYGIPPFEWDTVLPQFTAAGVRVNHQGMEAARCGVSYVDAWLRSGSFCLEPIVTHRLGLSEIVRGLALCRDGRDSTLKVVIEMPG